MNAVVPFPPTGPLEASMRADYVSVGGQLGFPPNAGSSLHTLPELRFVQPGVANWVASCSPDANVINIGAATVEQYVIDGGISFRLTVAHELTHAALLRSGYHATGHADVFLAVFAIALVFINAQNPLQKMDLSAKANWPVASRKYRMLHVRRVRTSWPILQNLATPAGGGQKTLTGVARDVVAYARQFWIAPDMKAMWARNLWTDYMSDTGKHGLRRVAAGAANGARGLRLVMGPILAWACTAKRLNRQSRRRKAIRPVAS